MTTLPLALLALLGLRVVPVEHLGRDAWLIPEASIVLIDASLDRAGLTLVADQALARAAADLAA